MVGVSLRIDYPEQLPVSARRADIAQAIRELYATGKFRDVFVYETRPRPGVLEIVLNLTEYPRLAEVRFDHLGTYRYSHDPGTGAGGHALVDARLPVGFFGPGGERPHRQRHVVEVGQHVSGRAKEVIFRPAAGVATGA